MLKMFRLWGLVPYMNADNGTNDNGGGEPPKDPPGDGGGDDKGGTGKTYDEAYVKRLRDESAANRIKARELEEKVKAMPNEITQNILKALGIEGDPNKAYEQQLADAKSKAVQAEERANAKLVAAEVKVQCAQIGIIDPDAAFALMDKQGIGVDDAGAVTGVDVALRALLEAKPYLKAGAGGQPLGGGSNPPNNDTGHIFTRAEISAMSNDEYLKNQAVILEQTAKGLIK